MPILGTNGNDVIDLNEEYEANPEDGDVNALAGDDLITFAWAFIPHEDESPDPVHPSHFDVNGGSGTDTLEFNVVGDPEETPSVTLDARTGNLAGMTFTSIERVRLFGASQKDTLYGLDGDDVLNGRGSVDIAYGGAGNDVYYVQSSDDQVIEEADEGIDTVRVIGGARFTLPANVENLILVAARDGRGNELDNVIIGNGSDNELDGEDGDDFLDGGAGFDILRGGRGDDTYVVSLGDSVREISGALGGNDTIITDRSYTLSELLENLVLTGTADLNGTGNASVNRLTGNAGDNRLDGKAGADVMRGLAGDDTYVVDNAGDQVIETASAGRDSVLASVSFRIGAHVEKLTLTGTEAINGTGNSGNNVITGNSAANTLIGQSGDDTIRGGTGDDRIFGGRGNDSLRGEGGTDRFYFDTALSAASNVDDLINFTPSDDWILLDRRIFSGIASDGVLSASAFRLGTTAQDATDRIIYNPANGNIYYDPDGVGGADAILFARVPDGAAVTAADFFAY